MFSVEALEELQIQLDTLRNENAEKIHTISTFESALADFTDKEVKDVDLEEILEKNNGLVVTASKTEKKLKDLRQNLENLVLECDTLASKTETMGAELLEEENNLASLREEIANHQKYTKEKLDQLEKKLVGATPAQTIPMEVAEAEKQLKTLDSQKLEESKVQEKLLEVSKELFEYFGL